MENSYEKVKNQFEAESFPYSPENPPPLELLESKIFAVHSTAIFPDKGILRAKGRNITDKKSWGKEEEPASFRPTLHFSLGEVVPEITKKDYRYQWEDNPYAIISPLKNLEGQLINVFPQDTFVLGDLEMNEGMVLLAPKGTDTSSLPKNIEVREYEKNTNLREAVDAVIEEKQGWHIRMKADGTAIGSVAHINGVEINDPRFFNAILEKIPYLSYGTHIQSEKGEAFRFGTIDQVIQVAIKNYKESGPDYSTVMLNLHKSLITHNLEKIEKAFADFAFSTMAKKSFEEKKNQLQHWLDILDVDSQLRKTFGKTISRAPEEIRTMILKMGKKKLKEIAVKNNDELPYAVESEELPAIDLASMLCAMPPEELKEFKNKNQALFKNVNLNQFYAHYAVKRWLVIKTERAEAENLDKLVINSLKSFPEDLEINFSIFQNLRKFLNKDSNRLNVSLEILRIPEIKKHLEDKFDFHFDGSGPQNLEQVIRSHPKTKILFDEGKYNFVKGQQEQVELLNKLGFEYQTQYNLLEIMEDFDKAENTAREITLMIDELKSALVDILKPMESARNLDDLLIGEKLAVYELLRRQGKAADVWRKLGLYKEFRKKYKRDSNFWNSKKSLIEIYHELSELTNESEPVSEKNN